MLDLTTRKWGTVFAVKDVAYATYSPDEKRSPSRPLQGVKVFDIDSGKEQVAFKVRLMNKTPT